MSNKTEDIGVRIFTDYTQALKDLQTFVGSAGKEFSSLPKIVQQIGASVDALTAQIGKMGQTNGPRDLQQDLTVLPPVVERLAKAANLAADNLEKIGQKGRRGLRETNEEASRLSKTLDKLVTGGKAAGAAMAGWQAGKMVFAPHVDKMVDYDTKLAHLANVAMADKSPAERIAGKAQLNDAILDATRKGGGTRDDAADALQKMTGSGALSDKDALTMLPSVMKGATASGARPEEIADIGIRAMQNFGFKATDMPKIMDMAMKSGNLGGFELKDMAKWLPQQMAEAANLGMKGEKGLAQLLALNQASITTAGSTDMAGNNVANLLAKINSDDTKKDFKKQGIDLTGSLQHAIGKGVDPITAFAKLVDQVMLKDKRYVALEAKRKGATGKEQEDILEQQLALVQGSAIGNVLQDRQAKGAFLGFKKQSVEFDKQVSATTNGAADGTTDGNYSVIAAGPGFKQQQSQNELLNAQNEAMQKLVPSLNVFWDGVSKVGREYPVLSTALGGGYVAVTTLSAGAGVAAGVMMLLTKNATAASLALGRIPGVPGMPGSPGAPKGSGGKTPLPGGFGVKSNIAMALAYGAYDAYNIANNDSLSSKDKKIGYTGAAGGVAGALAGAQLGATVGSVIPGLGTLVGGIVGLTIGGLVGNHYGTKAGTAAGEAMFGDAKKSASNTYLDNLHEKSKLNSPEARQQMQTAFNPMTPPIALPSVVNAVPSMAIQRQMGTPGGNVEAVQRALTEGLKPLPIDARLKIDVAFNEMGKPYVTKQSVSGKGIRLDTGPMMIH
ncbi:phage tail tape measure protein [Herminiimonas sp. CN]|uniref:phage tail tape measure protein n=1 Tax=Herminiimonas sp. CN TaxID=1349818 RepID=UPI00047313EE|nr:phage tail tape measure protein [Herminiimonas sp. CN]